MVADKPLLSIASAGEIKIEVIIESKQASFKGVVLANATCSRLTAAHASAFGLQL